jgi:hypothetical protein
VEKKAFGSIPAWEMLVLVVVVGASLSIGMAESDVTEQPLEVTAISGTMRLSSRASMDAFGLQDFELGPLATLDLSVYPIQSQGCTQCENVPIGFSINGDITITELVDDAGRSGRVEGSLNITYLRETTASHHIISEWFTVDWNAGPASSHWVVMLHHSPPKWMPSQGFASTFLETQFGFESRTGPFVSVSSLTDTSRDIEGCLPGGFSCSKATQRDFSMVATFTEPRTPTLIAHPADWHSVNTTQTSEEEPQGLESIRNILSLDQSVASSVAWSPNLNASLTSMGTWDINASNTPNFAPMSSFFQALGLPSTSYDVPDGTWTEADYSEYQTGFILDDQENLVLTIVRLD